MPVTPIKFGFVTLRKCDKIKNRLLIGIDQGCSLTKIVHLNKLHAYQLCDETQKSVTFQWSLYNNEDFEEVVRLIKDLAYIPEEGDFSVHITGVGSFSKCDLLRSIFGRNTEIITEEFSIPAGIMIGICDIGIESITKAVITPLPDEEMTKNPLYKVFSAQNSILQKAHKPDHKSQFPCLILNYGSASGVIYIDDNGKSNVVGMYLTGGKTLLGLSKCLLDINSYDELTELASHGSREKVDSHLNDVIGERGSKIVGTFHDLHQFSFGKLDDMNTKFDDCHRADIARSIIALNCLETFWNCARAAIAKEVSTVYLNGNLFQSQIFAEELQRIITTIPLQLELVILDFGYSGALAAMLCDAADKSKYVK